MSSKNSSPAVSQRAQRMPRSSIRRLFKAAQDLQMSGVPVIRLDIGDPDFPLPGRVIQGVDEALREGRTHYSPMAGIPELRAAVSRHLGDRKGIRCEPEEIVIAQGATQALNASVLLTCDPGDSILLPQVYWPNYMQQLSIGGVKAGFYPLDEDFQPRLEDLESARQTGARALLVNSPGNPTGALFPPETIRRLYHFARAQGLWIISDEAYTDFVFEGEHLSPLYLDRELPPEERRVIGVFSFSKSFAATGLRMGWTVLPRPDVAAETAFLNEPLTGSLTTPLQWGMIRALEQDDVAERREAIRPLRDLGAEKLWQAGVGGGSPNGGLFFFVDVGATGLNGDQFADSLLEQEKVAVVPGSGFGLQPVGGEGGPEFRPHPLADSCVRICFAVGKETLEEGLTRFGRFYQQRVQAPETG